MTSSEKLIEARRKAILANLPRELTGSAAVDDLARSERELALLQALAGHVKKSRRAWMIPLFVSALGVCLVGALWIIKVPQTHVELSANATAVEFVTAPESFENGSGEVIPVTSLGINGDADGAKKAAAAYAIQSMTFRSMTRAAITSETGSCYLADIKVDKETDLNDKAKGLRLELQHASQGKMLRMTPLTILPGRSVSFCASRFQGYFVYARITSLRVSRVHREGNPPLLTSSITSGTLEIDGANRKYSLGDGDRLSFFGVQDGYLFVFPGEQLRIVFSGLVSDIKNKDNDLAPNLLDRITRDTEVASVFTMATGLVGMLWTAKRFFGF